MRHRKTGVVISEPSDRDTRAVMYLRVASDGPGERLATQRAACEHIAEQYGFKIVREYADLGKPARLVDQVGLQRLLADLEKQRDAAFVVVTDFARLARNLTSWHAITQLIRNAGAEVVTRDGICPAELNGLPIDIL